MMFSFRGNDASIAIKRQDGVYVEGKRVETPETQDPQPTLQGEQHGNEQQPAQEG